MDYETAMTATVTRAEAVREIEQHQLPVDEFFADVGDKEIYRGADVLIWLGY